MNQVDIEKYGKFILSKFKGLRPGEVLRTNAIIDSIRKQYPMEYQQGQTVFFLLLLNELIKEKGNSFSSLTDDGYMCLHSDELPLLKVNLAEICNLKLPRERLFYELWEIIGTGNTGENPYYVKGPVFYDSIRNGLSGLPPTYTMYIESLPLKPNDTKQSRIDWYKTLFLQLSDEQVIPFLENLSIRINEGLETVKGIENEFEKELGIEENKDIPIPTNNNNSKDNMRKPKIFISHKTEDIKYAKALVDMMVKIGVQYDDIFCSSLPGCGVIFGKGILSAIREQYDEYELLVLFIHSPRYYSSPVSLNEMGAAWILKSEHRSFLTSDCSFDMLNGVITPDEAAFRAGQENTYHLLHDFRHMLEQFFHLRPVNDAVWEGVKREFEECVSKL